MTFDSGGVRNGRSVRVVRSDGVVFDSVAEAARCSGCKAYQIHAVLGGRKWYAADYSWRYADVLHGCGMRVD